MKKVLMSLVLVSVAAGLSAQPMKLAAASNLKVYAAINAPMKGSTVINKANLNLTNHGGGVIVNPHVIFIFWGPTFGAAGVDHTYATTLQAYRNQLGSTPEWCVIKEYGVACPTNLAGGTADWFDTTTPPVNVTDAIVQSKVNAYLSTHTFDASGIYEVVIPSTSYSSSGTSTSCGGPSLAYCAYHSWIGSGSSATKYSIQPWPGCSGCQVAGWTAVQNQEHFVLHETRETATDPTGNTWWDSSGSEADDKCAWSPTPFIGTGGYAYQYEWSNSRRACVKS